MGSVLWLTVTYADLLMEILWVFFGATLLSIVIYPVVSTLARWRIPCATTVLGVYVLFGLLLSHLGSLVAPVISKGIITLQSSGSGFIQSAISRIANTPLLSQLMLSTNVLAQNLAQRMDLLIKTAVSAVAGLGGMAPDVLIMVVTFSAGQALLGVPFAFTERRHRPRCA